MVIDGNGTFWGSNGFLDQWSITLLIQDKIVTRKEEKSSWTHRETHFRMTYKLTFHNIVYLFTSRSRTPEYPLSKRLWKFHWSSSMSWTYSITFVVRDFYVIKYHISRIDSFQNIVCLDILIQHEVFKCIESMCYSCLFRHSSHSWTETQKL